MKSLKQTGDTIVEVLIALSVIGFVIAGSYAITDSSLATERDSQRRSEALQIAQNQVESLKTLVFNEGLTTFFTTAPFTPATPHTATFCLYYNGTSDIVEELGGSGCAFDQNGNYVPAGSSIYNVSINNVMPAAAPSAEQWSQAEVIVTWAGSSVSSPNSLSLYYGFNNND